MPRSNYDALRSKIRGPVYPVPPAFNKDHSVDYKAVEKYVDYLNSFNVRTIMVTAGTSRLNLLSEEETRKLNKTVVEANRGRALTIAANPMTGSTADAAGFARHAGEIGADMILVYYPERYYRDDYVYDYFKEVASNTQSAVLIHGLPMRNAYAAVSPAAQYSVELCRRLSEIDNVIGMKEESGNETHRYKLAVHLDGKFSLIVAGASMRMYLGCVLFGVDAYLVGVGSMRPDIEEQFYDSVLKADYRKALEPVVKYEDPFFNIAFPMGWHIAMKGAMDLMGLMPATERPPLQPADENQRKQLRELIARFGWIR